MAYYWWYTGEGLNCFLNLELMLLSLRSLCYCFLKPNQIVSILELLVRDRFFWFGLIFLVFFSSLIITLKRHQFGICLMPINALGRSWFKCMHNLKQAYSYIFKKESSIFLAREKTHYFFFGYKRKNTL